MYAVSQYFIILRIYYLLYFIVFVYTTHQFLLFVFKHSYCMLCNMFIMLSYYCLAFYKCE